MVPPSVVVIGRDRRPDVVATLPRLPAPYAVGGTARPVREAA
ncbi:hypothetical protein [Nocardioides sp. SYSU DS0663]